MRGTRWLLLVAIAVILAGVAVTYRARKRTQSEQTPPKPPPLPAELTSFAPKFRRVKTLEGRKIYEVSADDFREQKDTGQADVRNVELMLYSKDQKTYDLVKSPAAVLSSVDDRFFSQGAVEITLNTPVEGQPKGSLVSIRAEGVSINPETGRVETDQAASFVFQNGEGKSTGAYYDPTAHELLMKKDVQVIWKPVGPRARPMKIEAASLTYKEAISEIWLKPWGRLTRDNTVVEGQEDVIRLAPATPDGRRHIRQIESNNAQGSDEYPRRKLKYSADSLFVDFNDSGEVEKITGSGNARLVSTSDTAETSIKAARVEMGFEILDSQSVLRQVNGAGQAEIVSKPLPVPGRQPGEIHVLRSDDFEMKLRPGGRELASVVAHSPGTLEFLPSLPAQRHRIVTGKDMTIAYGAQNRIESFHTVDAKTRTEPTAEEARRNRTVSNTASRELTAKFDPKTSRMVSTDQSGDFAYDEGERHARSARATMDSDSNIIVLETAARIWDATGSTSADRIRLDQRTGDYTADGRVESSRLPDKDPQRNAQMLSGDEPLQARATRMTSAARNSVIHYEGGATLWQGANRIQADTVDIDRGKRMLVGSGSVVTSLWEKPKAAGASTAGRKGAPAASPILTVTRAGRLVYTDDDRQAYYAGGVVLTRGGLRVKAKELNAFLTTSEGDSSLEKAFANGDAEVVQAAAGRIRTGTGEHCEYFTAESKIILRGSPAHMVDSVRKSSAEGRELTYYPNDDRLLVNGAPDDPVKTRITRK